MRPVPPQFILSSLFPACSLNQPFGELSPVIDPESSALFPSHSFPGDFHARVKLVLVVSVVPVTDRSIFSDRAHRQVQLKEQQNSLMIN